MNSNHALAECVWAPGSDLRLGPQVDDAIQLNVFAKLAVQPAMPVLVDGPLRLIHTLALIQVSSEDVPESRQTRKLLHLVSALEKIKGSYRFDAQRRYK